MRDRDEATAAVATEVGDPPVVGTTVGERDLRIGDLAFPQQMDRGVQQRAIEMLLVEQRDALGRVAGAVRDMIHVAPLR